MDNKNTQCKKLLDMVRFTNKHKKEFDLSMGDKIKTLVLDKSIEEFLDAKRISYNYTIVSLMEKNGIEVEDVYGDLDKIWKQNIRVPMEPTKKSIDIILREFAGINKISLWMTCPVKMLPKIIQLPCFHITSLIWNSYKASVYGKIEEYVTCMGYGK